MIVKYIHVHNYGVVKMNIVNRKRKLDKAWENPQGSTNFLGIEKQKLHVENKI